LSEETTVYMTAPDKNGAPALPKRDGPKGLLPSTWLKRALRLEYVVCGELRETTGTLLDIYPAGPVPNTGGARTLIARDSVAVVELGERSVADSFLKKRSTEKRRWEEYVEARTEAESLDRVFDRAIGWTG
jgi:hypothetical protein